MVKKPDATAADADKDADADARQVEQPAGHANLPDNPDDLDDTGEAPAPHKPVSEPRSFDLADRRAGCPKPSMMALALMPSAPRAPGLWHLYNTIRTQEKHHARRAELA